MYGRRDPPIDWKWLHLLDKRIDAMVKSPEGHARTPGEWQVQAWLVLELMAVALPLSAPEREMVMIEAKGADSACETWYEALASWGRGRDALIWAIGYRGAL